MLTALLLALAQETYTREIVVEAGARDRLQTPVVVAGIILPDAFADVRGATLEDSAGKRLPAQLSSPNLSAPMIKLAAGNVHRELAFVLSSLKAGQTATYTLKVAKDAAAPGGFRWTDTPGQHAELKFDDRPVLRYMDAPLDESSKQAREQTYKVYHHLFDPSGKQLVTKGPGGQFTHHRGIFYGFNKVEYGAGKKCDIWHCTGDAHEAHEKILSSVEGPLLGRHLVQIGWHGAGKEVFARERRELTVYAVPGGQLVEFLSELAPVIAPIKLDGDPQHAGFHFRAANEVDAKKTYFLRPSGKGDEGKEQNWPGNKEQVNLPWNAMSFVLGDKRYTCAYLDHPQNPKEARFSERTYGRFGSYFVHTVEEGKPLVVRYRLWVQEAEMKAEEIAAKSADFVDPPKVTLK